MDSDESDDDCIAVRTDAHEPLDANEVYDLLSNADNTYKDLISTNPPVLPKGGTVFLYYLGSEKS